MIAALKPLQIAGLTAAALAAVVGFWLLRNFDPNAANSPFPECMFHALTGWYCIGCGMTRALHALVHGDVPRAFSMNPLAMTMLAISPLLLGWKLGWQPAWLRPLPWHGWMSVMLCLTSCVPSPEWAFSIIYVM